MRDLELRASKHLLMSKVGRSLSASEVQIWEPEEDDMTEGDLGYGLSRTPGSLCKLEDSRLRTSRRSDGKSFSPPPPPRDGEERNGAVFQYFPQKSQQTTSPQRPRTSSCSQEGNPESNSELSNEELRQRLQETLEEVEILKTELEASQRQLEGKEEALKILQSMAVLGKATSHTQAVLQKTVEQKRLLEKEINALQWEIEFDQNRFKNIEESWTQKYDRLNAENAVLKENLKVKTEEIRMLKSENEVLNQQYLEALAMLDAKQQKVARDSRCREESGFAEASALQLAVLGACLCHGPGGSPCPCARTAASARKLVLQLKHELELLQKSKEEAYIMADAFRIAFEQQLMRRNDQALRLTQVDEICKKAKNRLSWKPFKADVLGHQPQRSKKTLGQKLLGMLPSENSSKRTEDQGNPQEVFKMLIDLLNDKEEALAHQRKVSYMLARALEDKDTASKENKDKSPMKENFPIRKPWQKSSQFSVLCDSIHLSTQTFNSVGCACSIQYPPTDPNYTRTLKRSCSLPSNIVF
ncbi:coiled-coil domain-containing protein 125 isoform X1 [Fukomys damarensis]|uniref:coiled-coil domain-containing protein 125 isoform X1 n=2 Tax=Fukomys damarensis TaxID=885580 RepID=UPI001455672A|nr:coiled-coil domain-containing protein 125 isoform X1 [Fukomys damarensis]